MLLLQLYARLADVAGPVGQAEPLGSDVMIRALALAAVAFIIGLVIGRPIINELRRRKIGKQIRIDGPQTHMYKMGTPTMGGIIFIATIAFVMITLMDVPRFKSLLLPLGVVLACGIVGGIDDLSSLVGGKRSGGMSARVKMLWLVAISIVAAFVLYYPLNLHSIYIPFSQGPRGIDIGAWYLPIAAFGIAGFSNAVNLTDGLDSQAGGIAAVAFAAYGIIAYLQGQEPVVVLCFTVSGALLAFLWFNAHPAQVFMGDLGSLPLGALLAVCAFMTGQWLILPVIGIIFVADTLSVILQVGYFKLTKGKRLFKISPLHSHFELLGWSETQVTLRFWIVGMISGMLGVALALG